MKIYFYNNPQRLIICEYPLKSFIYKVFQKNKIVHIRLIMKNTRTNLYNNQHINTAVFNTYYI